MQKLITILCRKGSKGLPDKNVREICGKPLVTWTLLQAISVADLDTDIVLSSNDERVFESTKLWKGLFTPYHRSDRYDGDNAPKLDAIREVVSFMQALNQTTYDVIIDLDVTNPMRLNSDIQKALVRFNQSGCDSLVSVTRARKNPYFNQLIKFVDVFSGDCSYEVVNPAEITRRQDTPEVYDMNAAIYIYKNDWLMDKAGTSPISDNTEIYLMPDESAFDIDSELDFKIVEMLMRGKNGMAKTGN